MNVFEFLALAVVVLSIAGVAVVEKLFGSARRAGETQLRAAEEHIQQLTSRIAELERHNDDLRQQLEWNRRLLEAQDRVLQQLGPPNPAPPPPLSRV
jgi:type II secretory pathway pseudopilin PulG